MTTKADAVAHIYDTVGKTMEQIGEILADQLLLRWSMSFMAKAMGGRDEFGESWAPISDGWIKEKKRTQQGWQRVMVSRDEIWRKRRNQLVGQLMRGGMSRQDAMDRAAMMAWTGTPEQNVPIGINTTRLLRSISPVGSKEQIREVTPTSVTLGSAVPHAKFFNAGRRCTPTTPEIVEWLSDIMAATRDDVADEVASKIGNT